MKLIKLWYRLDTFFKFNLNTKVRPYHLLLNQLQEHRAIDMRNILNKQIESYLSKSNNKERFVFVEIGTYMGESLELWGDFLEQKLENNFLIISIDPYIDFASERDKIKQPGKSRAAEKMSKVIEKIYMYFIHNISLKKKWRDKHIHLRMNSRAAFKIIENFNIKIDFCYIDGSHYYENFKFDLENYSKILESKNISSKVVNMHTIKPIDKLAIEDSCNSELIVSVEEHNVIGGLGSAIAEHKSSLKKSPKQLFLGIKDTYSKGGSYKFLQEKHRLTPDKIAEDILLHIK